MKTKDVLKTKKEDTNKKMTELKRQLMILQGQAKTGTPPKNPGLIKNLRRNIARLKTIQNQKEDKKE